MSGDPAILPVNAVTGAVMVLLTFVALIVLAAAILVVALDYASEEDDQDHDS